MRVQEASLPSAVKSQRCISAPPTSHSVPVAALPAFSELMAQPVARIKPGSAQPTASADAQHDVATGTSDVKQSTTFAAMAGKRKAAGPVLSSDNASIPPVASEEQRSCLPAHAVYMPQAHGAQQAAAPSVQAGKCADCASQRAQRLQRSALHAEVFLGALCCGFDVRASDLLSTAQSVESLGGAAVYVEARQGLLAPCHSTAAVQRCSDAVASGSAPWAAVVLQGARYNPAAWQHADAQAGEDVAQKGIDFAQARPDVSAWPQGGENGAIVLCLPGRRGCLMALCGTGMQPATF